MENDPELIEEMLVQKLTAACEEQAEALWRACGVHEDFFGPLAAERAIHAMAPDVRAAFEQLKTLVRDGVCAEVYEPGDRDCTGPRCFSTWDGLLAPYSHPTTMVLMFFSSAGGLRKDDVRCLSKLCLLLHILSGCYTSVLEVMALRLGFPLRESFSDTVMRTNPRALLEAANRYLATG